MRQLLLLVFCCCLLGACQSSPRKNYYLLTVPVAEHSQQQSQQHSLQQDSQQQHSQQQPGQQSHEANITRVIGIGPIEIADYLDRLHMVYKIEQGNLVMADNDYWAEPLDTGIARVIALNLTQRDSSRSFVYFPWRNDSKPDYSLRLHIHSMNGAQGQASINATWELMDNIEKTNLQRRHFIRSVTSAPGAKALVQAYSQLFAELAVEMDHALGEAANKSLKN